jgi:cytochrome c peroxidase
MQTQARIPKLGHTLLAPLFFAALLLTACEKDAPLSKGEGQGDQTDPVELQVPSHFPKPKIPADNQLTEARVELGKRLFFDPILSRDSTISCASCHKQKLAFTDGRKTSVGIKGRKVNRNAPSLTNLVFRQRFNWDGGVDALRKQIFVPVQAHNEMDMTFEELEQRLRQHPEYPALFDEAYGRKPDTYSIIRAIASYERTLVSASSPYDRYLQGDSSALSASQKRGMRLFFSEEAECFHCHNGALFSDHAMHNNGIKAQYEDKGRFDVTGNQRDIGKFLTPTLRNIAVTAPYMHDGSFATLEAVLDHYASGGKDHPNQSVLIQPLELSEQDKQDIINFLHSLTDERFLENSEHQPGN